MQCNNQSIVAIDLFCGAGGLTHGLASAGINVAGGIDNDPTCRYAYETNNPAAKFSNADISSVTAEYLHGLWGNAKLRLLAGCAPCQPFSTYNQGIDVENDDRYPLLREFSRLIRETKPDFVTMENVPSLLKKAVFNSFVRSLRAQGYSCHYEIAKCEALGTPQKRRRLVLLASKIGNAPKLDYDTNKIRSVKDALRGLPKLAAGATDAKDSLHRAASLKPINIKRIRASKPGGTWKDWPESIRLDCHKKESGSGYTPVYGRMSWEEPSPTITTQCYNFGSGRFGHPEQDRAISMREAALLQGFPKNYEFERKDALLPIRDLARMIGNAVPVDLGIAIGQAFQKLALKENEYAA